MQDIPTDPVVRETEEDAAGGESPTANLIARYRELVASAADLVPGMVRGETVEEIDASAQQARTAYAELSKRLAAQHWAGVPVPAGNPARSSFDAHADTLKPEAKIALALRRAGD